MKEVEIAKEVMAGDVSPVAMFTIFLKFAWIYVIVKAETLELKQVAMAATCKHDL